MLFRLFLLFTAITFLELFLLIKIGAKVGFWPTVLLVIVTGFLAAWLSRQQGRKVIGDWQQSAVQGKMPTDGLLSGVLFLVGCFLLITPGVLTDLFGLSMLIPATRKWVADKMKPWIENKIKEGAVTAVKNGAVFTATKGFRNSDQVRSSEGVRRVEGRVLDDDVIDVSVEDDMS